VGDEETSAVKYQSSVIHCIGFTYEKKFPSSSDQVVMLNTV
jgi:hypothetical protein